MRRSMTFGDRLRVRGCCAGVLGAAVDGAAQTSTGGLRGFVRDGTGGVLAGVTVEASSPARIGAPAVTVTDEQGLYSFTNLPVGEYTLRYETAGFTTVRRERPARRGRPHHPGGHRHGGRQRSSRR